VPWLDEEIEDWEELSEEERARLREVLRELGCALDAPGDPDCVE